MFGISKKSMEEMEAKSQAMNMIINIFAESGDKRAVLIKKYREFGEIVEKFIKGVDITEAQFEKAINLFDQFTQLLDEVLKGESEEE